MRYASIEVVIAGAVARPGRTRLEAGATVDAALQAVGGLAYRGQAHPAGQLVLRRRTPHSRTVSVHRFRIFEGTTGAWRSFPLEQRDVLVFDWSLGDDAR
jgi:protein involved in polysaccharide export with SLBB domain